MKSLFQTVLLAILLIGCSHQEQTSEILTIPVNMEERSVYELGAIFQELSLIQLPISTYDMLPPIRNVLTRGDTLYLGFKEFILIINKDGSIVGRIAKKGNGPGESASFRKFQVDQRTGNVHVLNFGSGEIIRYDVHGNFISEFRTDRLNESEDFAILGDSVYLSYESTLYARASDSVRSKKLQIIWEGNEDGDTAYFPAYDFELGQFILRRLCYFNNSLSENGVLFIRPANDTVYQIKAHQEPIPKFVIDYGKNTIPKEAFSEIGNLYEYCREKNYIPETSLFDLGSGVYYFQNYQSDIYYSSDKPIIVVSGYTLNGLGESNVLDKKNFPIVGAIAHGVIFNVESMYIKEYLDEIKQKKTDEEWQELMKKNPQFDQIYQTSEEEDNPVLFIGTL